MSVRRWIAGPCAAAGRWAFATAGPSLLVWEPAGLPGLVRETDVTGRGGLRGM